MNFTGQDGESLYDSYRFLRSVAFSRLPGSVDHNLCSLIRQGSFRILLCTLFVEDGVIYESWWCRAIAPHEEPPRIRE